MTEQHPLEPTAGELSSELVRAEESASALSDVLAAKIIADGERTLRARQSTTARPLARSAFVTRGGWLLATAATLAWLLLPSPLRNDGGSRGASSVSALRDSLSSAAGVMRLAWAPSTDPAGRAASGEVIWDSGSQRGVMEFTGLVPNDPRTAQYQLWIVDAERDARYPVDGGVFDVSSEGEVLVPIAARLPVGRPTLFAVTLEPPGGVVVSTRERLVLAAPVPTA